MADYTALDQLLDQAIQKHINNTGNTPGGLTPAQIAAYYGQEEQAPTGTVKELAKAVGRGAVGIPKLAVRAAQGGALDIGELLGYAPEQNAVAQSLGQSAEALSKVQQGETLAPNPEFAKTHPITTFVGENIEGALPYIAGSAASAIPYVGPFILPTVAGLSSQAESTEQQMKRGVGGEEALKRSVPGALTEAALFAAMPKAMGVLKGVPSATIEAGIKRGILPGMLGRPGGVVKGALQGLAAEAPYLYGMGEAKQAVDVAAGAMTPEEWKQTHTPEAVAHALGTSAIGGMGFGALGAIGQKGRIAAKQEEYRNLHQPIVDDKTPVDLNVVPTPFVQQELPGTDVAMKPKVDLADLVPNGSITVPYADAVKITKQLKSLGIKPKITQLGLDVTGKNVTRIEIPKIAQKQETIPEQQVYGPQTTFIPPTEAEPGKLNFGLNFNREPETKAEVLPEVKTPITEEIQKPVADNFADVPEELRDYISDFMTNPNSSIDAAALSQIIGVPEEVLTAKREEALRASRADKSAESLGLGKEKSTLASGKPEQDELLAKRLGVKYNGNQEDADGNLWPMFTDNETGSTLMLKPGDDLASRLQEKRDLFKQTITKIEPKPEPLEESPEGTKQLPLSEVTKLAKELVGESTPESEAARLSKKQERGYKNTKLARNILAKIHEDGFITKEALDNLKSNISNLEDVPKKSGVVRADRVQDYLEDTEGVLDKAVRDGVLRKERGEFSYGLAKNKTPEDLQVWYDKNIKILGKKRVNAAEGALESEKPTIEQNVVGDTDRFPTKADNARIDKATAEREEVTANAQRPHTIYQERMGAFKDELGRIAREIKKLPDGVKKTILTKEFANASKKFNKLIREGNFNKLKKEALPIYEKLGERLLQIKKYYEIQKGIDPELAQEHLEKAIKDFKNSDEAKRFKVVLDDLKSQARNTGRLELGEKLNEFREGVEEQKKAKDLTGVEKQKTIEETAYIREQEKKFLADMSRGKLSDAERIENADDILDAANASDETRAIYESKKTKKEKSFFLKNVADKAWEVRDKLDKRKPIQGLPEPPKEKAIEFNIKFNKKDEVVSKADKEYIKFAESKQIVGASSAIPKAAHTFVSHLAEKFGLDKMFIVSESDLKNSNIKDVPLAAREIYDEKGDYVGILHSTADGIDILALNDNKITNERTLVNTLSHEVGHAIIYKHFESASAETKQAIQNDFNSWLDKLSEKDSKAIKELYQDSGKSWENFKKDYKDIITDELASGGFKVNEEPMFHEYLAEQIAKYIKVTESQPKGILARFFNTLAEKLNYVLRFANKEFAKNHMPIQSVANWLDGLNKQERVSIKKNANLKKKTKVTYDDFKYVAKQVHNVFDPDKNDSIVKGMTDLVGANLADRGIVKQGWKGIMRLPWWREEVRPATENYEKSLETTVMLKKFLKATSHLDENVPGIVSLKTIEQAYNKALKTSREMVAKLLVEGDKEEINWTSPKEIKSETLKNISKEDFDIYKKTRDFVNQAWRRDLYNQAETLAYSLTENKILSDRLSAAILNKEIDSKEKLKSFLEKQPSIKAKGGLDTLITSDEFDVLAEAMYESGGIKDFFKEYSRDYASESLPGYIPRERLDGAEWLVELSKKDGTKIFSQGFYTKAEAQRFLEEFKKNPEKYAPKGITALKKFVGEYPTKSSEKFESLLEEPILRPISEQERFNLDDEKLIADKVSAVLNKVEGVPNKEQIVSAVRKEIMNHILAKRGMQNKVQRSEQLIEGYNEDSPLDAIQTALDKSAYRQARMRYIIDQSRLIAKTKDVQKKNAIREYVSKTLEPPVTGSKQVQMFKNMAAIYFMGFRPLTALMQLAQLHTVGAADLGMYLKQFGIKDSAQKLITKAELDVRMGKLSKIEKNVLKMAEERGVTWENSSQSFMFKDVDSVTSKHFLGKRVVKLSEIALKMFQFMEQHNRQSAILAAYRIFSKGGEVFNQEAFDKAMEYNNNTNFMMNKGNVPYWTMKHPIGMSMYTLMSYTLNMANWMLNRAHGSLSDLSVDKWTQRQAFMKMLGYTAVLAGASGLPFSDDLNKLIRKIFGKDLHLETKQFIKQNAGEDIANLVADGVFAPLGVNVSSNVAIRIPFLSGLLDGQTIGESVSGAAGALVMKGVNATEAAYTGQGRKFIEAASPEVLAGALRAERLYREGQRNASGKPVYFKGVPVKSTGPEALMQGLFGIKSERRANIMNISDSEYKLMQYWNDKKKIAESKAARGDYSAIQEFNRKLLKDKIARRLVKYAKVTTNKPDENKTAFELAQ